MRITIIGAGPGGYTAAFAAAKRGANVTLIEANLLGGTCLNCGCIPTKTLKTSAEVLETIKRSKEFGITVTEAQADMPAIIARKRKISEGLRNGLEKTCRNLGVTVIKGQGCVISASLVQVMLPDATVREVHGDKVIIATGSSVLNLPSLPIDKKYVLSSDDALELTHVPSRLLVVGGGVVGCELAFIFRSFGSEVTIIEGQNRLLPIPSVDEAMCKVLMREAKKKGIKTLLCRTVAATETTGETVQVTLGPSPFLPQELIPADAKEASTFEVDCVLTTVGRKPNIEGLGLTEANIQLNKRGYIAVNEYLETSVPGIYAIGDILGPEHIMLAHVASAEAKVAVENCFGATLMPDYDIVPSGIFTTPEIGEVGLTEAQATAKGLKIRVGTSLVRELGKAHAMGELQGEFRLLVDAETDKLLGAHFIGAHATDLIAEAALALKMKSTAKDIAQTIHAHPTLAEGIMETAAHLSESID